MQLRALDNDRSGAALDLPTLLLCGSLLEKSTGGLIAVGGLNVGGSVDPLPSAVAVVETAGEKQAAVVLMPVCARRALLDLSDSPPLVKTLLSPWWGIAFRRGVVAQVIEKTHAAGGWSGMMPAGKTNTPQVRRWRE